MSIKKKVALVFFNLTFFTTVACIGPKGFAIISHKAELPYLVKHQCIHEQLNKIDQVNNIEYSNKNRNYNSNNLIEHIYSYRSKNDSFKKVIIITLKNNMSTIIHHNIKSDESYDFTKNKLQTNSELSIMNNVESKIEKNCSSEERRIIFKEKFKKHNKTGFM